MTETSGTWRDFEARTTCAEPGRVWQLWTAPHTWGEWDRGLAAARLDGEFRAGAVGTIVGLDGRESRFVVDHVDPGRSVRWHVPLPGARMELTRSLDAEGPRRRLTHRVRFTGPLSRPWGWLLGRRFKPMLGPTVDALVALAERPTHRQVAE